MLQLSWPKVTYRTAPFCCVMFRIVPPFRPALTGGAFLFTPNCDSYKLGTVL